jgi:hypothetical protein
MVCKLKSNVDLLEINGCEFISGELYRYEMFIAFGLTVKMFKIFYDYKFIILWHESFDEWFEDLAELRKIKIKKLNHASKRR